MKIAPLELDLAEAPSSGLAYWVEAKDSVRLRLAVWSAGNVCKGTILFFTGRTEYIEKYGRTVTDFVNNGYSCLVIDWRGQGLSDRLIEDKKASHAKKFIDYQLDVEAMAKMAGDLNLPKPWYLFGNSMGACIGARSVALGLPVSACAFTGPMFGINLSKFEKFIAPPISWVVQALGLGHVYTPGRKGKPYVLSVPFEDNCLTNDPDMYRYYTNQAKNIPDAQIGAPTIGWLYQSLRECKLLKQDAIITSPCLTFLGDSDDVVKRACVEAFMENIGSGDFRIVKNGKHDLLCEKPEIRNEITSEICDYFESHRS